LVGIEVGVVSGVIKLESSGVEASDWRVRHEQAYYEARFLAAATELAVDLFDNWFGPIESEVRVRSRWPYRSYHDDQETGQPLPIRPRPAKQSKVRQKPDTTEGRSADDAEVEKLKTKLLICRGC
jgi:hypothetical protein